MVFDAGYLHILCAPGNLAQMRVKQMQSRTEGRHQNYVEVLKSLGEKGGKEWRKSVFRTVESEEIRPV